MERVQKMTTSKIVDGFYSVKGTHNEILLHQETHTKLIGQVLDALEKKSEKDNT